MLFFGIITLSVPVHWTCWRTVTHVQTWASYSAMYRFCKGKGKHGFVQRFVVNSPLRHSGMAHILKGSHSFTCTPHVHLLTEWTIPAFAFPAEGGTHLPTLEGWKAELAVASVVFPFFFHSVNVPLLHSNRTVNIMFCYVLIGCSRCSDGECQWSVLFTTQHWWTVSWW